MIAPGVPSQATRVSRGYLHHLLKSGEHLGGTLLSIHNLAYYQQLMARMRAAIRAQRFEEFRGRFLEAYQDDLSAASDDVLAKEAGP